MYLYRSTIKVKWRRTYLRWAPELEGETMRMFLLERYGYVS